MAEIVFTNGDSIQVDGTAAEVAQRLEEIARGQTFAPAELDYTGGIHHVNPAHVREVREIVDEQRPRERSGKAMFA